MNLAELLAALGMTYLGAAALIHLAWIRRYVDEHNGRISFYEYSMFAFRDVQEAARIAAQKGHAPWFLNAFTIFSWSAYGSFGVALFTALAA